MDLGRRILLVVSVVVLTGLLGACASSSLRLGWVEATYPGHMAATYDEFTGTEVRAMSAAAGDTLVLAYDADVDRGDLFLAVQGPDNGVIWYEGLHEDSGETVALPVKADGHYTIIVKGEATQGGFALDWKVQ